MEKRERERERERERDRVRQRETERDRKRKSGKNRVHDGMGDRTPNQLLAELTAH